MRPEIKARFVELQLETILGSSERFLVTARAAFELGQVSLYIPIAFSNPALVLLLCLEGLPQGEQVLGTVITDQGPGNRASPGGNTGITQPGEFPRISLSGQDCFDDGQACRPGEIDDHVMQLNVHLIQSFLRRFAQDFRRGARRRAGRRCFGVHGGRPQGGLRSEDTVVTGNRRRRFSGPAYS